MTENEAINLRVKLFFVTLVISSQICYSQVFQQQCNPSTFAVDTAGNEINWEQFPDFSLPFAVIYHGDAPSDSLLHPLHKGFSHIGGCGTDYIDTVWPDQRAYTWLNIANADGWAAATSQPWRMIKSPWGNNIYGYRQKWEEHLNGIWNNCYKFNPPNEVKEFDIVIADIEWAFHNDEILIAAHNPFQNANDPPDTTYINVAYNDWFETIGVIGKETFLCKFNMNVSDANQLELPDKYVKILPNPSYNNIVIEGNILNCTLTIYDLYGRLIRQMYYINLPVNINVSDLNRGVYLLKIERKYNKPFILKLVRD